MWSSLESTSHSILGKKGWCAKVVRITHACQCENVAWFPKRSHRMTMEHYENRVCLTYGNGNLVMYLFHTPSCKDIFPKVISHTILPKRLWWNIVSVRKIQDGYKKYVARFPLMHTNRKIRKTEFICICGSKNGSSSSTVNTSEVWGDVIRV